MNASHQPNHAPRQFNDLVGALDRSSRRLEKQLKISLQTVVAGQKDAKDITAELKTVTGDLAIIRADRDLKVSLLYKRMSGAAYIKGRCWWRGKQREVQIGTIPAVLKKLTALASEGYYTQLFNLENLDMTWEQVLGDEQLVAAIKALGQNRLRQYILERLQSEFLGANFDGTAESASSSRATHLETKNQPPVAPDTQGMAWYEQWRQLNVGTTP